jgi:hypothetical protein
MIKTTPGHPRRSIYDHAVSGWGPEATDPNDATIGRNEARLAQCNQEPRDKFDQAPARRRRAFTS